VVASALVDDKVADTEVETTSMAAAQADTADDFPVDRAIGSNHNCFPTTNRHRPESTPIGSTRRTIGRQQLRTA
jgi:hypothetical protein